MLPERWTPPLMVAFPQCPIVQTYFRILGACPEQVLHLDGAYVHLGS